MSDNERRTATPEETKTIFDRILEEGIKPNVETIARAHANGEVAIVFFEVAADDPESKEGAKALGWLGSLCECVPMNRTRAEALANALPQVDPAARWLRGRRPGRIFLFVQRGTFCIDYELGKGYSFAPGTTDLEWMS